LESFRSTLEDSVEAGLLLHVVDAADPLVWDKIRVVDEILDSIWAEQERVVVFNKCDVLPKPITHDIDTDQVDHIHYKEKLKEMAWENAYMFVSAVTWEWLDELKVLLEEKTKWM
jgi:50S ribosomal subunit-associated GTPase HflX